MMKRRLLVLMCATVAFYANAGIEFEASGTSAKGVDITFKAELMISGDTLTIVLTNESPVPSLNPDDLLGSFYFDIVNSEGVRPVLTYESATGDTYKGVKNGPDTLLEIGADIQALVAGDGSWQFKVFDPTSNPPLAFGIGTVGNSSLGNNFDGNVVGGIGYAIYTGDVTTRSLTNPDYLVKDTATFTFSGLTGFTEEDIVRDFAFGLGTAPDSVLTPEPATLAFLGLGGLLLRKRK